MTQYSYLNIIKRQSKHIAKAASIPLAKAHDLIALRAQFAHYHELVTVAKVNPNDWRLMRQALGVTSFADVIYLDVVWAALNSAVEDALDAHTADTNASGYIIENMEISSPDYDVSNGILALDISFSYIGEQDEDRPWSGNEFYVDAEVLIIFRGEWSLIRDDGLVITSIDTDLDRDYQAQQDSLYEDFLKDQRRFG